MFSLPPIKTLTRHKPAGSAMNWLLERKQFVKALLSNPSAVGAVAPSSAALAAAITESIPPRAG